MQVATVNSWDSAQARLRSMLSPDIFSLWFAPLRAVEQDDTTLTLEVANDFCEVWLKDNYMGLLQDVVSFASGRPMQVRLRIATAETAAAGENSPAVSANSSIHSCWIMVESMSARSSRFLRPSARCTARSTPRVPRSAWTARRLSGGWERSNSAAMPGSSQRAAPPPQALRKDSTKDGSSPGVLGLVSRVTTCMRQVSDSERHCRFWATKRRTTAIFPLAPERAAL